MKINNETTFILSCFFIIINLFMLIFFIISYNNIIVPKSNLNNIYNKSIISSKIINLYLTKKKIIGLKIVNKSKKVLIINSYKNKTFYIDDSQLFNQYYFLFGIKLDYILGRTFFATQLYLKNKNIKIINLLLYIIPPLLLLLFIIFNLFFIIFFILIKKNPNLLKYNFFYFINNYSILNLILFFIIVLYLILLSFNNYFKQNLENLYENEMWLFVKKEFPKLYNDWIIARNYSRSIKFTYLFGYNFIFKKIYKYTGPFSL